MPVSVDLQLGINLLIGSVPVSLGASVNTSPTSTTYQFDGCVQTAEISLGYFLSLIGSQFSVDVQLPPELNLTAKIDYIAGQIVYTKPETGSATTQLGIAARFELTIDGEGTPVILSFYGASNITDPAPPSGNPYVVGAAIETNLDFSKLPVVGVVPGFNELSLTKVGFSYTNATSGTNFAIPKVDQSSNPLYTRQDPDAKNASVYSISTTGNQGTFNLATGGFALTAGFKNNTTGATMSNFALPMALPAAPPPAVPQPAPFYPQTTSPPASPVHWISINKTFGPVNLQQIGLNYTGGRASFGFSAGFTLAGFALDLQGLTITFPLPIGGKATGGVDFDLEGLAFDLKRGSLHVGGAFFKVLQNGAPSYYGEVIVQVGTFGMKALGGYSPAHDGIPASFFLYLSIDVPIGGPPFLFITGISGGFGINRTLKLPTIDTLAGYLLLPNNAPSEEGSAKETIQKVLPQLEDIFNLSPGQYWVAAGIKFTSFEMINAFALVTVAFGVDFQIGVLGSCAMSLPLAEPVAYIEIDIIASYTQSSGLLAVVGVLSPASYIFGGFAHLSGGFAFYTWVSGPNQGNFVVSIGGYNPAYALIKPPIYPSVPRLGISFGLGPFQVTGQAYFALTPAMMMAGISMSATWGSGSIKAWFDVGVDFLIAWAPFHYEASAYLSIGVSANLGLFTINLHVGATLNVWGPPFGGQATVDLDVISFTINFGAKPAPAPPLGWTAFRNNFLPADSKPSKAAHQRALRLAAGDPPLATNIIKASVSAGLIKTDYDGYDWIIDPEAFRIVTNSTIPANNAQWAVSASKFETIPNTISSYNSEPAGLPYLLLLPDTDTFNADLVWNPTVNIAPMKQADVQSFHNIQLCKRGPSDPPGTFSEFVYSVTAQPLMLDSNAALWAAAKDKKAVSDPQFVSCALTGFELSPIPQQPDQISVPLKELLFTPGNTAGFTYQTKPVNKDFTVQATALGPLLTITISGAHSAKLEDKNYILSSLADPWVASQRDSVAADLVANGFSTYTPAQIDITALATETALTNWPMVELLEA